MSDTPRGEGKLEYSTLPLGGASVTTYVTMCGGGKVDIPLSAYGDERELHVDNNFGSPTRLFIIHCARSLVWVNLFPFLHPFGHLNVMHA